MNRLVGTWYLRPDEWNSRLHKQSPNGSASPLRRETLLQGWTHRLRGLMENQRFCLCSRSFNRPFFLKFRPIGNAVPLQDVSHSFFKLVLDYYYSFIATLP